MTGIINYNDIMIDAFFISISAYENSTKSRSIPYVTHKIRSFGMNEWMGYCF